MKKNLLLALLLLFFGLQLSAQWKTQNSGFRTPGSSVRNISAVNAQVAWASSGFSGSKVHLQEVTRTLDGGKHWKACSIPGTDSMSISNLCALNADTAWVCLFNQVTSSGGKLFFTGDGGNTWSQLAHPSLYANYSGFMDAVYFRNAKQGISIGDPVGGKFVLYTTSDGGQTWTAPPADSIPAALSQEAGSLNCYCAKNDTLWFGTTTGRVFRTVNFGNSWTVSNAKLGFISNLTFRDSRNGLASSSDGTVSQTSDGGITWTLTGGNGPGASNCITYIPGTANTYIGVSPSGSSYTTDGSNWFYMDHYNYETSAIAFVNPHTGWCGDVNTDSMQGGMFTWSGFPALSMSCDASPLCKGTTLVINYTTTASPGNSNIFTAELSNSYGSFAHPVIIGTKKGTQPDTLHAVIPANIPQGYSYRIRIRSNAPADTSVDNGTDLQIGASIDKPVNPVICSNTDVVTLTTASYSRYTPHFQWQVNTGNGFTNLPGDTQPTLNVSVDTTFIGYRYKVIATGGCPDATDSATVTVLKGAETAPDITVNLSDVTACIGTTAVFYFNCDSLETYTLQWEFNYAGQGWGPVTGNPTNQIGFNITDMSLNNSKIRCRIIYCGGSRYTRIANLNVKSLVTKPVTVQQHGDTLVSSASSGNQWYKDGQVINGANSRTYVATLPGDYKVEVSDTNSCNTSSFTFTVLPLSQITRFTGITIPLTLTPNPSNGSFTIGGLPEKASLAVYNSYGQLIYTGSASNPEAQLTLHEKPGVYVLKVSTDNGNAIRKFVIE